MYSRLFVRIAYVSKRLNIGIYDTLNTFEDADDRIMKISEFKRQEGKHTMMMVKFLSDKGINVPQRGGELAEKFGRNIGRAVSAFGWQSVCIFMCMEEVIEKRFLKTISIFSNRVYRDNAWKYIIFDDERHSEWWIDCFLNRRN